MTTASEAPPSFDASVDSSNSQPPEYDGRSASAVLRAAAQSLIEREYTLENGGKPWAFLKVNCRPTSAHGIPSFIQGEPITGTVELHLAKAEHVQAVTLEARGESLSVGQEPIPFLSQETTLWSLSGAKSSKLKGDYVWPFSVELPDKVNASVVPKGPKSEYALPPSFSERASPAYLEYKLIATFRRGKFRVDNALSTSFAFLPRSRTPAPSDLRQLAYRENSTPLGPEIDLEGWEVLEARPVTGTVFESRQIKVLCSLALAKPLSYTRGTFIPLFLTLECSDHQALDLFATRDSLTIRLLRALNVGLDATDEDKPKRTNNSFIECVGQGVYWFSDDNNAASNVRRLEGEIPVRRDLKPSFVFPRLCIKYYVSFTLTAPGFTISSGRDSTESIFSREVIITTDTAPGPTARSRIPPAFAGPTTGSNFDISIGMLTAANQRFLHHHAFG